MRKLLLLNSFIIGCSFFSLSVTAQNVEYQTRQHQKSHQQTVSPELEDLLKNMPIPPQPNRAQDAREARLKMSEAAEMETPYRPTEIVTRNERGETFMKYTYVYDEKGTYFYPATPMVRDYKQWNKAEQVWDNNMRFRLILNENGDIIEASTDTGYKTQWDNNFHTSYTYDNNHNQLTADAAKWENDQWYSNTRWTNTFDAQGNILSRVFEHRPTDSQWAPGMRQTWTYNDAGQVLSELFENYDSENGKYTDYNKNVSTYDEKGNRITWLREQKGLPFFRQTLKYDDRSNNTSMLEERWVNEEWVNYTQSTSTFDDQNRETSVIWQKWTEGNWAYTTKNTTMYYTTNPTTMQIFYKYDAEKQVWLEHQRMIKAFNDKKQQTNWALDNWVPEKKQWQTNGREIFTYNTDGNLTNRTASAWSPNEEKFVPTSIFDYEYDGNMNGIKVMSPKKQAKEWINLYHNHMQSNWGSPDFDSWIADGTYIDLREFVKTTGVTLNKKSHEMETELNVQLEATVAPENASNKEIHWSSSNPEVARVSVDGRVYGITPGTATITARSLEGNKSAVCEIKVVAESSIRHTTSQPTYIYRDQILRFSGESISKVQVTDINGRVVFHQKNGQDINTSNWDKGVYFMQLSDASGNYTYKLAAY